MDDPALKYLKDNHPKRGGSALIFIEQMLKDVYGLEPVRTTVTDFVPLTKAPPQC